MPIVFELPSDRDPAFAQRLQAQIDKQREAGMPEAGRDWMEYLLWASAQSPERREEIRQALAQMLDGPDKEAALFAMDHPQ